MPNQSPIVAGIRRLSSLRSIVQASLVLFVILGLFWLSPEQASSKSKPIIGDVAIRMNWKWSKYKGKRTPLVKSVRVYGPGLIGANPALSCGGKKRTLCIRARRSGRPSVRRTGRDEVRFTNVNWLVTRYDEDSLFIEDIPGTTIQVRVRRKGYLGRYFYVQNAASEDILSDRISYDPEILWGGCIDGRGKQMFCPTHGYLNPGSSLRPGESLSGASANEYRGVMKHDGRFVVSQRCAAGVFGARWRTTYATPTGGNPGAFLSMLADGNLVVFSPAGSRYLWQSGTAGNPGAAMFLDQKIPGLTSSAAVTVSIFDHRTFTSRTLWDSSSTDLPLANDALPGCSV